MSKNIPLLSFVIPAYNASIYIDGCLHSILNSDFTDFEVICIDDGSTDDTLKKITDFSLRDDRIKVHSKLNEGQGVARNWGVTYSSGKYIAFVDIDDFIDERYFEVLVPYLNSNSLFDFINFRMDFITASGSVNHVLPFFEFDELNEDLIFLDSLFDKNVYSSPCNKVYKRSFLLDKKIEFPSVRKNEDIYFSRIISYFADKCIFINDILYHVNITDGSTSRSMSSKSIVDTLHIYEKIDDFLYVRNDYAKYEEVLSVSKKKVFSNLLILCSLRIEDDKEFNKAIETFKGSAVYKDFKSLNGLWKMKTKNIFAFIFVYFGGVHFFRYFCPTFFRRFTY